MSEYGVLINIGSNTRYPNKRGRISNDQSFDYLPIPEYESIREKIPTYLDLGFSHVDSPDLLVHLDPEFNTFTYGHIIRFGEIRALLNLEKNDHLFFYATLSELNKEKRWAPYIIGYFKIKEVVDCRDLSDEEIFQLKAIGFGLNAHLKRNSPSVDILIKGTAESILLNRAFPLADKFNHLELKKSLINLVHTLKDETITPNTPWYRWTMITHNSDTLINMIQS